MNQVFWTFLGFIVGFGMRWAWDAWRWRQLRYLSRQERRPSSLLVRDGEQRGEIEVDRTLIEPSPIPRSIAIVLLLIGSLTVGTVFYDQGQRNEESADKNEKICQLTAQVLLRQNDGLRANAETAKALHGLLESTNSTTARAALEHLAETYESRSAITTKLPPLPASVIKDCQDGVYDGIGK